MIQKLIPAIAVAFASLPLAFVCESPAIAAAATAAADQSDSATATALTINFQNIEEPKGTIMLAIFNSEASFDNGGKPARGVMVPVSGGSASTLIEGLPAGRYAFKLLHDIDGNGKMGTNPYGMPVEPYGFSNNAVGSMGPAKWADAAFDLNGAAIQTIIFP